MAILQVKDNVEAEKPVRGTVIATINDEEAATLREIVILYDAIRMTHITLTLAKEIAEKKANWWETICVKYGLPHTWPLSADYVEKVIFVGE